MLAFPLMCMKNILAILECRHLKQFKCNPIVLYSPVKIDALPCYLDTLMITAT